MKRWHYLALLVLLVLAGCTSVPALKATTTPQPTITATAQPPSNLLPNPTLNPYTADWFYSVPPAGIIASQTLGGGVTFTFTNAASSAYMDLYLTLPAGSLTPGVTYLLSYEVQGNDPMNINTGMQIAPQDAAQTILVGMSLYVFPQSTAASSTLTRYATTFTAPPESSLIYVDFFALAEAAPNSGSVSITQLQLLTLSE